MEDGLNGSYQKIQNVYLRMDHISSQREEFVQILYQNMVAHALKMKMVLILLVYLVIQVSLSIICYITRFFQHIFVMYSGHGQWSSYGSWSKCSEYCVQYQERYCNSPQPAFGGNNCSGKDRIYRFCLEEDCECKFNIYHTYIHIPKKMNVD